MTRWLSAKEDRAWRGWLAMSDLLRGQIGRDLQTETGLSEADFAVLVYLSEASGARLRMSELGSVLHWSKSRLSHQLTRMEARGLVCREGCPSDARSAFAVLTPCGRREIERAAPLHVESVRRHLIDLLDARQVVELGAIADTVVAHLLEQAGSCESEGPPAGGCAP